MALQQIDGQQQLFLLLGPVVVVAAAAAAAVAVGGYGWVSEGDQQTEEENGVKSRDVPPEHLQLRWPEPTAATATAAAARGIAAAAAAAAEVSSAATEEETTPWGQQPSSHKGRVSHGGEKRHH